MEDLNLNLKVQCVRLISRQEADVLTFAAVKRRLERSSCNCRLDRNFQQLFVSPSEA